MVKSEIQVIFYSGYKGEETPRALVVGGREIPVETVLLRTRRRDEATGRVFEAFRLRAGGRVLTVSKTEDGAWEADPPAALIFPSPN